MILLLNQIKDRTQQLLNKKAENKFINSEIAANSDKVKINSEQLEICKNALSFLENLANSRRSSIKSKIESVLTEAIKMIYGEQYHVELIYSVKNNRSHMDIEVVKKTPLGIVQRTMEGFGGGISDCLSVPLRLLVLLGSKQSDKVCILDEAYKHVDTDRIENVANFIKNITKKLGVQIILLSHHDAMLSVADNVFQIKDDNGKSIIKQN